MRTLIPYCLDLILKEDRDREQREHVAMTLRTMRAEESRKNHEIERLTTKNNDSTRALAQAQAAERAATAEVKRVEKAMKSLQDQSAKLKTTLAQVKTQCTNDVRKRDLELTRLKTHLQGQQRGNKVGMTAPSITMTPSNGIRKVDTTLHDLADAEYSLKQETTEFLTQLSQSLSDENDNLILLIRGTLGTVRELLGLPASQRQQPDSAIGSMGSAENNTSSKPPVNMLHALPTAYETLAADMDATLEHLKSILTSPNFVSIEEVEIREEEIVKLREGWERMEQRWKEVLVMMEGWRKKMDTGVTLNIDDLRRGIGLLSPDNSVKNATARKEESSDQSLLTNGDISEIKLPEGDTFSSPQRRTSSDGNGSPKRKRDVLEPPEFFDLRPSSHKTRPGASPEPAELDLDPIPAEQDESLPRMTIAEKLDLARAEAQEAATTVPKSSRGPAAVAVGAMSNKSLQRVGGMDGATDPLSEQDDTLGKMSPVVKKTKIRGRPKRRKSTLSPGELEELIRSTEG